MPYMNIMLNVAAAISVYTYLWNNYDIFHIVVIHLGDFHLMKENFTVNLLLEKFFHYPYSETILRFKRRFKTLIVLFVSNILNL